MPTIRELTAGEVLDSRGRPTVRATCLLSSGARASASVPSGASTGKAEALELRDGDASRYGGLGCRTAVHHVESVLHKALSGRQFMVQHELDEAMIELDGTANKSHLGANAILGVSLAFARATACEREVSLYRHFADVLEPAREITHLPRPTVNLFSGGKHAGGQVEVQDVLVTAGSARSIDEAMASMYAVYQEAARLTNERYGARALVADEGGLAPDFASIEDIYEDVVTSIAAAGFDAGREISLCVDVAASHFFENGEYRLGNDSLTSEQMIDRVVEWTSEFPIVSVEDGLAENDWEYWPRLRSRLNGKAITLGDDLLATHPDRIRKAIDTGSANALLLKVNQIGTLTEAAAACRLAQGAGWKVVVSARSGETEDNWLADLAVGWGGDALKVGSITRSERLAKWNRLLEIERETGLPVVSWPNERRAHE